ncbi:hypothetical protein AKO1_001120 [Acrasis kona]|uniref:Uncharacterized protein n=1 Tax=Acrasis kona TaxID=1008807 RepID=A0AAW2ZD15_9EUKA
MYPIGPEANQFDKDCRAVIRRVNNQISSKRNIEQRKDVAEEEIRKLQESTDNNVVQYMLQYVGLESIYHLPEEMVSLEAKASSFQRCLGRFTRDNSVFQLPIIPLFDEEDSVPTWSTRDLYPFELIHYHVPPKPQLLDTLKEITTQEQLVGLVRTFEKDIKIPRTTIGSQFDHKSFHVTNNNVYTSHGGKRFLETGYVFITPELWYSKQVMTELLSAGVGILMYEPCKHLPRCDSYDSTYYRDVFYFQDESYQGGPGIKHS